jgi:hypothetical protein
MIKYGSAFALIFTLFVAASQGLLSGVLLPHQSMGCMAGKIEVPTLEERVPSHQDDVRVKFRAYTTGRTQAVEIIFREFNIFGKAQIILELEYAQACIASIRNIETINRGQHEIVRAENVDLCSAIRFIGTGRYLNHEDFSDLEEYAFSGGWEPRVFSDEQMMEALKCVYR